MTATASATTSVPSTSTAPAPDALTEIYGTEPRPLADQIVALRNETAGLVRAVEESFIENSGSATPRTENGLKNTVYAIGFAVDSILEQSHALLTRPTSHADAMEKSESITALLEKIQHTDRPELAKLISFVGGEQGPIVAPHWQRFARIMQQVNSLVEGPVTDQIENISSIERERERCGNLYADALKIVDSARASAARTALERCEIPGSVTTEQSLTELVKAESQRIHDSIAQLKNQHGQADWITEAETKAERKISRMEDIASFADNLRETLLESVTVVDGAFVVDPNDLHSLLIATSLNSDLEPFGEALQQTIEALHDIESQIDPLDAASRGSMPSVEHATFELGEVSSHAGSSWGPSAKKPIGGDVRVFVTADDRGEAFIHIVSAKRQEGLLSLTSSYPELRVPLGVETGTPTTIGHSLSVGRSYLVAQVLDLVGDGKSHFDRANRAFTPEFERDLNQACQNNLLNQPSSANLSSAQVEMLRNGCTPNS